VEADKIKESDERTEEILRLKQESKLWTAGEWEAHLESVEVGLKESQNYNPWQLSSEKAFSWQASSCPEHIGAKIENLINALTPKQQIVIKKIYFEGLSERQVARILLISRQGVFDLKKRALRKLKKMAPKLLGNSPIAEMPPTSEGNESIGIGMQEKEDSNA
jgi:DNA-directed RNA polymerase specialized sigma subunit